MCEIKIILRTIFQQVLKAIQRVYHASWLRSEQRRTYDDLVLRPVTSPLACCQRSNLLNQLSFVNGYNVLSPTVSIYFTLII